MIRNYIKTTYRNLIRHKANAMINILGLSLGIACSIVLLLLAQYSTEFDQFHKNKNEIFRMVTSSDGQSGERDHTTGVPTPFPDAIRADFPEIKKVSFVSFKYEGVLVAVDLDSQQPRFFQEDQGIAYADQEYLEIFDISWLEGDMKTALAQPNAVVISKKLAEKYFPGKSALNQSLQIDKDEIMTVTGVMENPPKQSDFPFQMYISVATVKEDILRYGWGSISSDDQCYVLLSDANDQPRIEEALKEFVVRNFGEDNGNKVIELQPLSDFHHSELYSNYNYNSVSKGNILALRLIAIFLILTACVNFINLSTAMAIKRSREVGVRKVMGSTRAQLIKRFLGEFLVIVILSVGVALGLAEVLILYVNPFLDTSLAINLLDISFISGLMGLIVAITLLSGFYPAMVLSGFQPALAMKSVITRKASGGIGVRKGLVVFQFFISQVFVIGTIVVVAQLDFIRNRNLGFVGEAVINVEIPERDNTKKSTLKTEVSRLSSVEKVSLLFSNPTSGSVSVSNFKVQDDAEDYMSSMKYADENYIDIFNIELLEGVSIGASDTVNQVVVNEEWLKYTNINSPEEAIGKMVRQGGRDFPIVGVMKDFHSVSLRNKLNPLMLMNSMNAYRRMAIKINLANVSQTTNEIKAIWKQLYPEYEFEYRFVDEQVAEFYESEEKMAMILGFFSTIAIIIGSLGLFGLASFMINQKVKEIGVRKVLGASVLSILQLFSKEYMILIVVAFVFAAPLAWYGMDQWLQNFEYKIDIGFLILVTGILTTTLISMLTVGYKSIRAAKANPVDSLRSE